MLLKWTKVTSTDQLIRTGQTFLVLYKGRISLAEFNEEKNHFTVCFDPEEGCYVISGDRLRKFTHLISLSYPDAYPQDFVDIK